jgi:hypothetical protein
VVGVVRCTRHKEVDASFHSTPRFGTQEVDGGQAPRMEDEVGPLHVEKVQSPRTDSRSRRRALGTVYTMLAWLIAVLCMIGLVADTCVGNSKHTGRMVRSQRFRQKDKHPPQPEPCFRGVSLHLAVATGWSKLRRGTATGVRRGQM